MDLLLDTHAFLWFITGDNQLPEKIVKLIDDSANGRVTPHSEVRNRYKKWL